MNHRARGNRDDRRPWYMDLATGCAFAVVAVVGGRGLRMVPVAALFVFLGCAGMAWFHFKSAWRNYSRAR